MIKINFLLLTMALIVSCSSAQKRTVASVEPELQVLGLGNLDLNDWTERLMNGEPSEKPITVTQTTLALLDKTDNLNEFYSALLNEFAKKYSAGKGLGYRELADGLFEARRQIRRKNINNKRAVLNLLETLGEEALYILSFMNPQEKEWAKAYSVPTANCRIEGRNRTAPLNSFTVCQADVIASKGGAGSSSFFGKDR
jgi:hypothetical protein